MRSGEEIYGKSWLLRLSSLPSGLYTQTVDRLIRGDSVYGVTRWLLAQPDRGGLQNVHEWTLHKYLNVLAKQVRRMKRENPPPSQAEMKSQVIELKLLATPECVPRRRGNQYQSIESFVGGRCEKHNRVILLLGFLEHFWEQLERLRAVEEEYHHDKKLPTQAMCRARAQIGQQLKWIMVELRENDALELVRQKTMASLGEVEDGTLDGNRANAESTPPPREPRPEPNPYAGLSPTDLLCLNGVIEKSLAVAKLTRLQNEQQSQPASPPVPG